MLTGADAAVIVVVLLRFGADEEDGEGWMEAGEGRPVDTLPCTKKLCKRAGLFHTACEMAGGHATCGIERILNACTGIKGECRSALARCARSRAAVCGARVRRRRPRQTASGRAGERSWTRLDIESTTAVASRPRGEPPGDKLSNRV